MNQKIPAFHNQEWLSNFLRKYKFTPLWAGFAMVIINLIINIPLALRYDALYINNVSKGLFGEPSDWLYDFVVQPIIIAYFCWLQTSGDSLVKQLTKKIQNYQEDKVKGIQNKWSQRIQNKRVPQIAALISLIFVGWFIIAFAPSLSIDLYQEPPYPSWVIASPVIVFARGPIVFLVFYALLLIIFDLIILIQLLNELTSKCTIKIEPFDPDKAGGLGFIGRFSGNLSFLIFALAVLLSSRILRDPQSIREDIGVMLVVGIVFYFVIAPLVFFMPLQMTHVAMVKLQKNMLMNIAFKIDIALEELGIYSQQGQTLSMNGGSELGIKRIKELTDKIEYFNNLRDFVKKNVPTWPFSTVSLSKFYAVVLTPLIPTLWTIAQSLLFD